MKKRIVKFFGISIIGAVLGIVALSPALAVEKINLKVVGTWGNLNSWKEVEKPFWTEQVKADSSGNITADAKPMTDLGLKGFEIMRLLQLGLFDVAHGIISYLGEDPVAEGIDLAGVVQDWKTAKKVVEVYRNILEGQFEKTYGVKLLSIYPFPSQALYCNKPINSLGDLKGKKIRTYSRSINDMVTGLGATGVTIPFAEVVPALQLGTVDCAITGTFPAFAAKWNEVTSNVVLLRMGYAFSYVAMSNKTWNKLDTETQDFFAKEAKSFEKQAWALAIRDDEQGVACLSGASECKSDKPGNLKKIVLSKADDKIRRKILESIVLKNYGERCGPACVEKWNSSIGSVTGLTIQN